LSRQSGSNLLRNGWLDGLGWKAEDQARWVLNVLTLLGTKYGLRARPILGRTQNNPYIIIYLQHSSTKCFILDTDVTWTLCLLEDWGRLLFVVRSLPVFPVVFIASQSPPEPAHSLRSVPPRCGAVGL
jgi:hypothetical protein